MFEKFRNDPRESPDDRGVAEFSGDILPKWEIYGSGKDMLDAPEESSKNGCQQRINDTDWIGFCFLLG